MRYSVSGGGGEWTFHFTPETPEENKKLQELVKQFNEQKKDTEH